MPDPNEERLKYLFNTSASIYSMPQQSKYRKPKKGKNENSKALPMPVVV